MYKLFMLGIAPFFIPLKGLEIGLGLIVSKRKSSGGFELWTWWYGQNVIMPVTYEVFLHLLVNV